MSPKILRYFNLLWKTKFGLSLSSIGVLNYFKFFIRRRTPVISPSQLSPVRLTLMVTMRCNFRCKFCVEGLQNIPGDDLARAKERTKMDMTPEIGAKIMDTEIAQKTLVVVLSGGEPLLNRDIIEIIKEVKKRRKLCGIITNGSLLPLHLTELVKSGLDDIQVSLYDHYLTSIKKTLPEICKVFPINASYVLLKSILDRSPEKIEEIIDLCEDSGCNSLKFNICVPYNNDTSETIFDDNEAYKILVSKIHQKTKKLKTRIFLPQAVSRIIKSRREKKCYLPWQLLLADSAGRMTMCCGFEMLESPMDLFAESSDKSYNSHILQNIRKCLLADDASIDERCRQCPHRSGSFASRV